MSSDAASGQVSVTDQGFGQPEARTAMLERSGAEPDDGWPDALGATTPLPRVEVLPRDPEPAPARDDLGSAVARTDRRTVSAASRGWRLAAGGADVVWAAGAAFAAAIVTGLGPHFYLPAVGAMLLVTATPNRHAFRLSMRRDAVGMITAGVVGTAAAAAVVSVTGIARHDAAGGLLSGGIVLVVVALGGRWATLAVEKARRCRGHGAARALIIGDGEAGRTIGRALAERPEYGIDVVGHVRELAAIPHDTRHRPSRPPALAALAASYGARMLILTPDVQEWNAWSDPVGAVGGRRTLAYVVPRLHRSHAHGVRMDSVAGVPLVRLRTGAAGGLARWCKRAIDVTGAAIGLVLLAPAFAALAIAVRRDTGPGCIFKQQRVGLNGRVFTLYKFRSLKPQGGEGEVRWSIDGDPRLGAVGRFIRESGLDELPQLVNVLKGDMSLVGPRPERPYFVEMFAEGVPGYSRRHRMPAGVTGLAAINGLRGDTGIVERAHYDNLYIDSWSLWLDMKIILKTALRLAGGRA